MTYGLQIAFSFSIGIAAIIGLWRIAKVYIKYLPFIYITILGVLAETATFLVMSRHYSNGIVLNLDCLLESILWVWQFRNWNAFDRKWKYYTLQGVLTGWWAIETFAAGPLNFDTYFIVIYSFAVVFLSINQINQLIVSERRHLLTNARFLICCGAIVFYTYQIFVESFYLFNLGLSDTFMANIYYILVYVNLFVNLLYALATLWIPTRQRFSLPF